MTFLVLMTIYVTQIFVYSICILTKKNINKWISFAYTLLNIVMAFPFGFLVLFLGVMGTDSGTEEAIRGSMLFVIVSAVFYIVIFIVSLTFTIKSFIAHKIQQKDKEPN